MASGTNSRPRKTTCPALLTAWLLGSAVNAAAATGDVPLLVVRLPDLEHTAWRAGRTAARRLERCATRAFTAATSRVLRGADLAAHDDGSEIFLVALLERARRLRSVPSGGDCRSTLARLSAALSDATGLRVEAGWTIVRSPEDVDFATTIAEALERGARERERYDFFTAVGHELRTPLTSIRGYLETLLDGGLSPQTARRFLQIAHAESLRLARLVEGMFEISLFDMHVPGGGEASCDVAVVIDRAVDTLRPQARARTVTISNDAPHAYASVTADHLMQMLTNLIDNALKHGREGGRVQVHADLDDERFVRICVEDDGPGIIAHEREQIFSLMTRGSTAAPGWGIGLAFVRLMAERIGGDVSVGQAALGGASFALRLPLATR
jgi:signal transduction histidine kinase